MIDFREVKVWQKAHHLTVGVYRATAGLADSDPVGLAGDMRRSCAALSSNLASADLGKVRGIRVDPEFTLHMRGALNSAGELESRLQLARDLDLLREEDYSRLERELAEVRKTITSFLRTLGADRY